MPLIVDGSSGLFLKAFGQGLTDKEAEANVFSHDEARTLCALYYPTYVVHYLKRESLNTAEMLDYEAPKPDLTPFKKGQELIWVDVNGTWMVAEKQHLALATLRALGDLKAEREGGRVA